MTKAKLAWAGISVAMIVVVSLSVRAQSQNPFADGKPAVKTDKPSPQKSPGSEVTKPAPAQHTGPDAGQCVGSGESAAAQQIEKVLDSALRRAGLDFADQPLQDVVMQLAAEYEIPIQLDKPALEEAGIATNTPVNATIHNISLRSAMRLMLRQCNLTWIVRDECLVITTTEVAEKNIDTCVYNVQGLVDDSDAKSMQPLVDVIQSCVATETWAANQGGAAEIRALPPGLLVISQTHAVQEAVRDLLDKIRTMREQAPLRNGKSPPH